MDVPSKSKKRKISTSVLSELNSVSGQANDEMERSSKIPKTEPAKVNSSDEQLVENSMLGLLDDMDFDAFDFPETLQTNNTVGGKSSDCASKIPLTTNSEDPFTDDINFDEQFSEEEADAIKFTLDLKSWKRCLVSAVERDGRTFDMILTVREEGNDGHMAKCRLQGPWSTTKVDVNDLVSIIAEWNNSLQSYCVSLNAGFIIICPDTLVSGTTVTNAVFCSRKAVLTDRYTGIDSNNKIMFIGSLVHELFQAVLSSRPMLTTTSEVQSLVDRMITSSDMMAQLYETNMDMDELKTELSKFVPKVVEFVARYITGDDTRVGGKDEFTGKIDKILDIEENIWIPQMGLKGKVDVTVKIRRRNKFADSEVEIMPLEVKTGKPSFSSEHRGQVSIYQMMMTETARKVKSGLLLYLRDGVMREVVVSRNDQRDLIMLRNVVAYHTTHNSQSIEFRESFKIYSERMDTFDVPALPEPINHHSACEKCPYNTICCAFLSMDKSADLSEQHPLRRVMSNVLEHLQPSHVDYFIHWSGLLALEEKASRSDNDLKSMWTDSPEQREKRGKAITNLVVFGEVLEEFNTFVHTFKSQKASSDQIDFTLSGISDGDYVRVSTNNRVAVAAGRVMEVNSTSIIMSVERNLLKTYPNSTFILDNVDSQSMIRMNLANLGALLDGCDNFVRLRSIIIDRKEAIFKNKVPRSFADVARSKLNHLNSIQQRAVIRSITATDYMLIKGLPGTGKTETLTSIIKMFMVLGKTVLITSHTHSAVDNVLMRLLPDKLRFMRLGESSRVAPAIRPFCASNLTRHCKTPDDIRSIYDSYPIVGVTCLGSNHPILLQRYFDVCLVDESTQVLQTTIIRPMFAARKFILVGDPDQLPPIVRSNEARALGADESLFKRLDNAQATIVLTKQYRMNETITRLANDLTYGGALQCGSENVSSATLKIPQPMKIVENYPTEKWLHNTLCSEIKNAVILLDTENVYERSVDFHKSIKSKTLLPDDGLDKSHRIYKNFCEAAVTIFLIKALVVSGVKAESIGIIAPYVAQVQLLSKLMRSLESEANLETSIEVNTVDQYQGRDKEIIILSCTKSNNPNVSSNSGNQEFEILQDVRRLTVAVTRSKHKLIILGDVQSLAAYTPFSKLISSISPEGKITLSNGEQGFDWTNTMEKLDSTLKQIET